MSKVIADLNNTLNLGKSFLSNFKTLVETELVKFKTIPSVAVASEHPEVPQLAMPSTAVTWEQNFSSELKHPDIQLVNKLAKKTGTTSGSASACIMGQLIIDRSRQAYYGCRVNIVNKVATIRLGVH